MLHWLKIMKKTVQTPLPEWRERLYTRIMFNLDLLKSYQLQTSAQLFNPIFNFLGAKVNSGSVDAAQKPLILQR